MLIEIFTKAISSLVVLFLSGMAVNIYRKIRYRFIAFSYWREEDEKFSHRVFIYNPSFETIKPTEFIGAPKIIFDECFNPNHILDESDSGKGIFEAKIEKRTVRFKYWQGKAWMEVAGDGDSANISISANFVEKSDTIFWITADRIDKSGIIVSLGLKILVIYLIVTFWTFVSFIQFAFFEFGLFREIYKNPLIVFELSFGVVAAVFLLLTVFSNQFRSVVRWLVFDLVEDVLALRFGPTRAMKARSARSRIGEMP